jgi:pimeloyl-ACP methyl ester carboxylesterase
VEKKKKFKEPWLQRFIRTGFPWLERLAPALADRLFVYVFFTPFRHRAPAKEIASARHAETDYVLHNNRRICVYRWGQGPWVWVVHGWAGRATQFRKFIPALNRAGFGVIGFDGPGHGRSGGKQTNAGDFKEIFDLLAAQYGLPEAIIGHSFGGAAALYAIAGGLPVRTLIEIGSPVDRAAILKSYLSAINGSNARIAYFECYVERRFGKPFEWFTARRIIRRLTQPLNLLLVHDEEDRDVPIHQAELLVSENPWVKLHRTRGLGHNRILRDAGVIDYCIQFIKNENR